jgi:hypothetical protein
LDTNPEQAAGTKKEKQQKKLQKDFSNWNEERRNRATFIVNEDY